VPLIDTKSVDYLSIFTIDLFEVNQWMPGKNVGLSLHDFEKIHADIFVGTLATNEHSYKTQKSTSRSGNATDPHCDPADVSGEGMSADTPEPQPSGGVSLQTS